MSTLFSVGQMNQLGDAFEAHGMTPEDVTKLRSHPDFAMLRLFARGQAKITLPQHLINCDANPYLPNGWKVEEHKQGGQLEWNPTRVKLYLSKDQRPGKSIVGNKLRKELANQSVLNACVLDYLLANPTLIPEDWKGKFTFFWGTIYRDSDGDLCVRYLYWFGSGWYWFYDWLDSNFYDSSPAAISA
jgi:hypothetical protein